MWYWGFTIILRENLRPPGSGHAALSKKHWGIKIGLHPSGSGAPNIEIAVSARFEKKEHNDQDPHQQDRQRRGIWTRKGDRHGEAEPGHRPVRCVIKARAPRSAPIDFAAIQVRERADLSGIELTRCSGWHVHHYRRYSCSFRWVSAYRSLGSMERAKADVEHCGSGRARGLERRQGFQAHSVSLQFYHFNFGNALPSGNRNHISPTRDHLPTSKHPPNSVTLPASTAHPNSAIICPTHRRVCCAGTLFILHCTKRTHDHRSRSTLLLAASELTKVHDFLGDARYARDRREIAFLQQR